MANTKDTDSSHAEIEFSSILHGSKNIHEFEEKEGYLEYRQDFVLLDFS
jgi:hypothetical protein